MSDSFTSLDSPKLFPYFLIIFGMSAGLSSVITLVAEFKQEFGFSNFEIGLTIFCGFAFSFIALKLFPRTPTVVDHQYFLSQVYSWESSLSFFWL